MLCTTEQRIQAVRVYRLDMATIAVAVAALVILLLASRWNDSSSNELGYMSEKWLAEYNTQHP